MPFAVVQRMSCGFRRPFSSSRLRVVAFMRSPAHYFHLYSCRLCKRVQDIRIILCWPKTILSCVFANKSFATSRFPCSRLLFFCCLLLILSIYSFLPSHIVMNSFARHFVHFNFLYSSVTFFSSCSRSLFRFCTKFHIFLRSHLQHIAVCEYVFVCLLGYVCMEFLVHLEEKGCLIKCPFYCKPVKICVPRKMK